MIMSKESTVRKHQYGKKPKKKRRKRLTKEERRKIEHIEGYHLNRLHLQVEVESKAKKNGSSKKGFG